MKLQNNIAQEFNEFSKNYTEDMTKCVPYYLELLNDFTTQLPENFNPKSILDLGCGNGNAINGLTQLFPDAEFTLVDASKDMLDLCKRRFPNHKINYINSYFNDFEFKTESYDIVTAGFSLHHCSAEEKQAIYKQIYNALKPNGIFICSDLMINKDQPEHEALINFWDSFVNSNYPTKDKWHWIMDHYNEFDKPSRIENHIMWLNIAGLTYYTFKIYDKYWAHFKATKI